MPTLWDMSSGGSAIRRGLRISLIEAAVTGAMFAATETWLVPLLVQGLGAAAYVIGLLTIIPQLGVVSFGAFARPIIVFLGGNRRTVLLTSYAQIAFLAGLSVPLHWPHASWAVPVALSLSIAIGLNGAISGPAWISWMGDLVPRSIMGRYLGWRWRIFAPSKLFFGFLFALAIEHWPPVNGPWGFQIVFAIAALSRVASTWLLRKQPEPRLRPVLRGPESQKGFSPTVGLWGFLCTMHRTDLGRWTMVWASLNFGMMIAGPFFSVYMLKARPLGLELDYSTYWWLANASTISRFVGVAILSRMVDLYGPSAMLRVAVLGIFSTPIVWIMTTDLLWLFTVEILNGLAWSAAECSVIVLLFTCNRDPLQRTRLIGYHQFVAGMAVVVGSSIGTILIKPGVLPELDGSEFRTLFLISIVMRLPALVMAAIMLPTLKTLDPEQTRGLWRMVPGAGLTMTIGRGLLGVFRRPEG
jgi:MFS family permease